MCGIVGIAGDITHAAQTVVFRDMLDVCQVRGRDSTGVVRVDQKGEYDWVKQVGSPTYLCDSRPYEHKIERGMASVLLGHCRSKTVGDISIKNAHPFDINRKIIGVHNGTLRGHRDLDTYEYSKVDSEVLYGHLEKNGPDETFNVVEGAFACVWWNAEDKTLNFIRNNERPLWFTWSKDCRQMFWASELWMFSVVSRKLDLWDGGEGGKVFIELPPRILWSFSVDAKAPKDKPVLSLAAPKEIAQRVKPPVQDFRRPRNDAGSEDWKESWIETKDGTWERVGQNGGQVPDPFLRGTSLLEELDDAIPWQLSRDGLPPNRNGGHRDLLSLTSSKDKSLTGSQPNTGSRTPSTGTKSSSSNVISLPAINSRHSRSNSNDGALNDGGSSRTHSLSRPRIPQGVSFRIVAGMNYITDNATKSEYLEKDFLLDTGGCCTFCKQQIERLSEVGTILTKTSFICRECLVEPKISFGGEIAC